MHTYIYTYIYTYFYMYVYIHAQRGRSLLPAQRSSAFSSFNIFLKYMVRSSRLLDKIIGIQDDLMHGNKVGFFEVLNFL